VFLALQSHADRENNIVLWKNEDALGEGTILSEYDIVEDIVVEVPISDQIGSNLEAQDSCFSSYNISPSSDVQQLDALLKEIEDNPEAQVPSSSNNLSPDSDALGINVEDNLQAQVPSSSFNLSPDSDALGINAEDNLQAQVPSSSNNLSPDLDALGINAEDNLQAKENEVSSGSVGKKTRKKRHLVDENEWNDRENKRRREEGKAYLGKKRDKTNSEWDYKIAKDANKIKSRCNCLPKTYKCSTIDDVERQLLFKNFWKMSWSEKKLFVQMLLQPIQVQRRRPSNAINTRKREKTFNFFLPQSDTNTHIRVCKTMFLNTLSIGAATLKSWGKSVCPIQPPESPVKRKRNIERRTHENMVSFLQTLPKLPSHYCRARSNKEYLQESFTSKIDVFNLWKELNPNVKGSICLFNQVFAEQNIGLFKPKKDLCDVCEIYKHNNISKEKYDLHIIKKKEAREEMKKDLLDDGCMVFTMDLESVMLAPFSKVSTMYYKTKLLVHNFTIYNNKSNKGWCFLWNEVDGGLNSSEFASIIIKFLDEHADKDKTNILYSDGCTYQNRNVQLANAIINLVKIKKLKIIQKYLEKGHTQMEVDSMHAAIEKVKKRRNSISVPFDYVEICALANKTNPYEATYLHYGFFKDMEDPRIVTYKSIRPGKKVGDPCVVDIRQIHYGFDGEIEVKLRHSDKETTILPTRPAKKEPVELDELTPLYKSELPIKIRKYNDLQELKPTIDSTYHHFYDSTVFKLMNGTYLFT